MTPADHVGLVALAKQIEDLSPPEKLRLAAGLLENRKAELAYTIARKVIDELGAALAISKGKVTPAEAEARAAGIEAAIVAIEARVAKAERAMADFPAVLARYQDAAAAIVPGLLDTLRKLAAETRAVKPNPFDGWPTGSNQIAEGKGPMTPLFNEADQNLLRALPTQTRKAVVDLHARGWKRGIVDAAECVRSIARYARHSTMGGVYRAIADELQRYGDTHPGFDLPSGPTPDPTTLSDAEILDLPPLDRAKVLADLAAQGLILAVMLVDVGVPCPHCDGGTVSMAIDGLQQRVDCTRCDGVGSIDGRRRCADRGCLSYDEPLTYSLGNGWECSRKHGHAERERADRFVTPVDLAAALGVDNLPEGAAAHVLDDAFPSDEPETFATVTIGGVPIRGRPMNTDNTIKITEHIDRNNPGMVTVTIDVDARFAELTHTMPTIPYVAGSLGASGVPTELPRVVLTMTLPREAWPGALCAPNPFDGWTIQDWKGPYLWATRNSMRTIVGGVYAHGWYAWPPTGPGRIAEGPETGQAGRDAVAAALRGKGAKL